MEAGHRPGQELPLKAHKMREIENEKKGKQLSGRLVIIPSSRGQEAFRRDPKWKYSSGTLAGIVQRYGGCLEKFCPLSLGFGGPSPRSNILEADDKAGSAQTIQLD